MTNHLSPETTLRALIDTIQGQRAQLEIVDRALSPEEEERSQALSRTLEQLRVALTNLTESPSAESLRSEAQTIRLHDGRYRGGNGDYTIDLRLDEAVSGIISADLYLKSPREDTWLASVRTRWGERARLSDGVWEILGEDTEGRCCTGELRLVGQTADPLNVMVTLRFSEPLAGVPGQASIALTATWCSRALRSFGIEIEREQGVDASPIYNLGGRLVTVQSCFAAAGFETFEVGQPSQIPSGVAWGTAQLHALMVLHTQASLERKAWELHLLLLGLPTRNGLLGVMFDETAQLPRQGSAVFAHEIQRWGGVFDRKLLQTTVHELGHALNLAHRFEREVGHADSTSFMNYDWRYCGGGRKYEFWNRFDFTFDPDELAFLRHAPLSAIIPGGKAFHSVPYWSEGRGGYSPYFPEVRITDLELVLHGPIGGAVFDYLQPIFLEVELINRTGVAQTMPRWWLDPKSGALDIVVRRVGDRRPKPPMSWVPIMQRCRQYVAELADVVPAGQSLKRNLNLTFGAAGFSFAEPGEYEVQAVVAVPNERQELEYVVPSNKLRIRIAYPHSRSEENDAMVLLRDDVGAYLALGGSRVLAGAHDDLEEVRARRQGRARRVKDPVVAAIRRCQGIDAGRQYTLRDGKRFVTKDGDFARAAELLSQLGNEALSTFDPETAATTKALAERHRRAAEAEQGEGKKK